MSLLSRTPVVRHWAGACAVVVVSSLSLTACTGSDDPVPTSAETSDPSVTASPSPTEEPTSAPTSDAPATPSPTPTTTPTTKPSGTAVPIYFVGDGPGGKPRLFREFQRVGGDPLTAAARIVAGGGEPDDPDYRTLWPQTEIASVSATDGVLLVQVPSDAFTERPDGMSGREARLAIQQLVYTLQGVQQERVPVMVQRDGGSPARLFGIPTDAPFRAASALRTLSLMSITSPAEGDTVAAGDTVRVSGVANSFEASVFCELLVGGEVVGSRGITAEGWAGDRLFPFEGDLGKQEAPPGQATIRCSTDDPTGGAEGNGPSVDTKTVTLK